MAENCDNNLDLGMVRVNVFVAVAAVVVVVPVVVVHNEAVILIVLSTHHCMVDHQNWNCLHRIHHCRLGWVEEILSEKFQKKKIHNY